MHQLVYHALSMLYLKTVYKFTQPARSLISFNRRFARSLTISLTPLAVVLNDLFAHVTSPKETWLNSLALIAQQRHYGSECWLFLRTSTAATNKQLQNPRRQCP
jgi:hypothetical protein